MEYVAVPDQHPGAPRAALLYTSCLLADDSIYAIMEGQNSSLFYKVHLCTMLYRVLYFYHRDDTFVLLHLFRKRTQRTPRREIERARAERDDYLARYGECR